MSSLFSYDQQPQQNPIFSDYQTSLDCIDTDDLIKFSPSDFDDYKILEKYSTDFYSNDDEHSGLSGLNYKNSVNSPFPLPLTPNSVQDWKGEELRSCMDSVCGKLESNKPVKRLKKQKKPKKKPENVKDCLHVWEFLRDLLKGDEFNGRLIKWLNKEKGIFKILSPNEVSNLWGKKKANKEKMDYPNMARGIRYSREEGGYFDLVTKEDGFGKKLVYRFSKKASMHCDWLRSFMGPDNQL